MAYSDYGGYAYKNGKRVIERSDAIIAPDVETVPGMYPGWALIIQGYDKDEAMSLRQNNPNGHVVIGDDPVYIGMYKQSSIRLWYKDNELPLIDFAVDLNDEFVWTADDGTRYLDVDFFWQGI